MNSNEIESGRPERTMPVLVPVPVETKGQPFYVRGWRWLTFVRRWQLAEHWRYRLPNGLTIIVPKTFRFDGASIPKPLWLFLSPTGLLLIPGLVHDFAYRYRYLWVLEDGSVYKYGEDKGRKDWDKVFFEVGKEVNGMPVINLIAWFALELGGHWAWKSNADRNAPDIPVEGYPLRDG